MHQKFVIVNNYFQVQYGFKPQNELITYHAV